jgi:hypothetical protein
MTLTQLKTRVLQHICVLASGENPDADDTDVVQKRYEMVHNLLTDKNLIRWSITDDIPDALEIAMVMILSFYCASEFGIIGPSYQQLKLEGAIDLPAQQGGPSVGERTLRKSVTELYSNAPATPDYF